MTIREEKARLREKARTRRRALARAADPAAAGAALAERLLPALLAGAPRLVGGYWPLGDEIDPRPLLEALAAHGLALALPAVERRGAPLVFRRWQPGRPLESGAYGVMVPPVEAEPAAPDLLLVPLLAFDREGYRLGHGGGYYDRTIAALAERGRRPRAIGLAFAGQEVEQVPREGHDAPLDLVATEAGVVTTGREACSEEPR